MADRRVKVFDACAILAWLLDEEGAAAVDDLIADAEQRCLLTALNICEVYYDLRRRNRGEDADALESLLVAAGFEIVEEFPSSLWKEAGRLKADLRRVSLADCFAMALVLRENGELVTSDHHELDRVAESGLVPVRFVR